MSIAQHEGVASPPPGTGAGFDWRRFFGYLTTILALAMLAGVLAGLVLWRRPLEARAAGDSDLNVRFAFDWPAPGRGAGAERTTWMPVQFQEELLAGASRAWQQPGPGRSRLDSLASALAASGWFRTPPTVRRESGGLVVIEGDWRVPAAVVRHGGMDHLVSWEGLPMPPVYRPGAANLRAILEPSMPPPSLASGQRDYATPWPGEDIAASLELLGAVVRAPWGGQVAAVDASGYSDRRSLALMTTMATRVEWGGRPSRPRQGDVSTDEKLNRLTRLYRDCGRIDGRYDSIDVSQPHLVIDLRPGKP